ncbi:MAG: hypothetical protein Q9218_003761, partial [Villophora microphyllina]
MAGSKMGKFKEKCKKLFHREQSAPSDDVQPKQPRVIRKLVKKSKKALPLVTTTATVSEVPVSTPQPAFEVEEASSATPATSANHIQTTTQAPGIKIQPLALIETAPAPPATQSPQSPAQESTPTKSVTVSSLCTPSSGPSLQSTSERVVPSSRSSQTTAPPSPVFLCELPGSYTFPDAIRKRGAEHWGGIAASVHAQQIEDPFRDFGMVAPFGLMIDEPNPSVPVVDTHGVFERSVGHGSQSVAMLPSLSEMLHEDSGIAEEEDADSSQNLTAALMSLDRIMNQDLPTDPVPPNPTTDATISTETQSPSPDIPAAELAVSTADDESSTSQPPSASEHSEHTHMHELQDLHGHYEAKIVELEDQVKASRNRKEYVEKLAVKKLAAKDRGIALRSSELDTARSVNNKQEAEIQEMRAKIANITTYSNQWELWANYYFNLSTHKETEASFNQRFVIEPLTAEVARLTHGARDNQWAVKNRDIELATLRKKLENVPDYSALHTAYVAVCEERAMIRVVMENQTVDLEDTKKNFTEHRIVYENAIAELATAKEENMRLNMKIWDYLYEHEDEDPTQKAELKDLLKKKAERYGDLEKEANETFRLWKDDGKKHAEEVIRMKGDIKEWQDQVYNLEGYVNNLESEVKRHTTIHDKYFKDYLTGSGSPQNALQDLYEASRTTAQEAKTKIGFMKAQIAAIEKEKHKQERLLDARENLLNEKDATIKDVTDAKVALESQIEALTHKYEMHVLSANENANYHAGQLEDAQAKTKKLEKHVQSMFNAGFGVQDEETLNLQQAEVVNLQNRNAELEEENQGHREQQGIQRQKDFHTESCAAFSEHITGVDRQNYENAQQEIVDLKQRIELMEKGCDPDKFELAQAYSKLQEKHTELEKQHADWFENVQE